MTGKAPGAAPRLDEAQLAELAAKIEAGPQSAGYGIGVWTDPMIADWIEKRFGVRYHTHDVPSLLNSMGFSVQRPRKRLADADAAAQARWPREKFPAIQKEPQQVAAE